MGFETPSRIPAWKSKSFYQNIYPTSLLETTSFSISLYLELNLLHASTVEHHYSELNFDPSQTLNCQQPIWDDLEIQPPLLGFQWLKNGGRWRLKHLRKWYNDNECKSWTSLQIWNYDLINDLKGLGLTLKPLAKQELRMTMTMNDHQPVQHSSKQEWFRRPRNQGLQCWDKRYDNDDEIPLVLKS